HMTLPETPVGGLVVHQDGAALWQTLDDALQNQGVIFCALDTAVQEHPELVETHFITQAVPIATSKVTAFRGGLWKGRELLYVPPGIAVQLPLQALTAHMTASAMEQSHVLLIADTHSQVTFVQEDVSGGADLPGLHNGVVELYLKAGAHVTYLQVQNWSRRLWGVSYQRAILAADSQLCWAVAALGSRVHWTAQSGLLRAPGTGARLYSLVFAA